VSAAAGTLEGTHASATPRQKPNALPPRRARLPRTLQTRVHSEEEEEEEEERLYLHLETREEEEEEE